MKGQLLAIGFITVASEPQWCHKEKKKEMKGFCVKGDNGRAEKWNMKASMWAGIGKPREKQGTSKTEIAPQRKGKTLVEWSSKPVSPAFLKQMGRTRSRGKTNQFEVWIKHQSYCVINSLQSGLEFLKKTSNLDCCVKFVFSFSFSSLFYSNRNKLKSYVHVVG